MPVPMRRYEGHIPHLISFGGPSQHARKVVTAGESSLGEGSGTSNNEKRPNENSYTIWLAKDMILMPLRVLRGLNVIIDGDVTEEWTLWLEDCMKANKGEERIEFVGEAKAKKAAQILKGASSGEEFSQMIVKSDLYLMRH